MKWSVEHPSAFSGIALHQTSTRRSSTPYLSNQPQFQSNLIIKDLNAVPRSNHSLHRIIIQSSSPASSTTPRPSSRSYPHSDQTHSASHCSSSDGSCGRCRGSAPPLLSAGTPGCGYRRGNSHRGRAPRRRGTGSRNSRRLGHGVSSLGSLRIGVGRGRGIDGVARESRGSCRIGCRVFRRVGRIVECLSAEERIAAQCGIVGLKCG